MSIRQHNLTQAELGRLPSCTGSTVQLAHKVPGFCCTYEGMLVQAASIVYDRPYRQMMTRQGYTMNSHSLNGIYYLPYGTRPHNISVYSDYCLSYPDSQQPVLTPPQLSDYVKNYTLLKIGSVLAKEDQQAGDQLQVTTSIAQYTKGHGKHALFMLDSLDGVWDSLDRIGEISRSCDMCWVGIRAQGAAYYPQICVKGTHYAIFYRLLGDIKDPSYETLGDADFPTMYINRDKISPEGGWRTLGFYDLYDGIKFDFLGSSPYCKELPVHKGQVVDIIAVAAKGTLPGEIHASIDGLYQFMNVRHEVSQETSMHDLGLPSVLNEYGSAYPLIGPDLIGMIDNHTTLSGLRSQINSVFEGGRLIRVYNQAYDIYQGRGPQCTIDSISFNPFSIEPEPVCLTVGDHTYNYTEVQNMGEEAWQALQSAYESGSTVRVQFETCYVDLVYGQHTINDVYELIDTKLRDDQYVNVQRHCWDRYFLPPYGKWDCSTLDYSFKCLAETLLLAAITVITVITLVISIKCCRKQHQRSNAQRIMGADYQLYYQPTQRVIASQIQHKVSMGVPESDIKQQILCAHAYELDPATNSRQSVVK